MTFRDLVIEQMRKRGLPDAQIEMAIAKATMLAPNARPDMEIHPAHIEALRTGLSKIHNAIRTDPTVRSAIQSEIERRQNRN